MGAPEGISEGIYRYGKIPVYTGIYPGPFSHTGYFGFGHPSSRRRVRRVQLAVQAGARLRSASAKISRAAKWSGSDSGRDINQMFAGSLRQLHWSLGLTVGSASESESSDEDDPQAPIPSSPTCEGSTGTVASPSHSAGVSGTGYKVETSMSFLCAMKAASIVSRTFRHLSIQSIDSGSRPPGFRRVPFRSSKAFDTINKRNSDSSLCVSPVFSILRYVGV